MLAGNSPVKEASLFLKQAENWSTEKVEENASCFLECSRLVLASETAGHEEKLDCIKWLGELVEFVPPYELESDVLNPFLIAADGYLDGIYSLMEDANDVVKSELFALLHIIFRQMTKILVFTSKQDKCGVGDIPSLFKLVPHILNKSFHVLADCPSLPWKTKAKELLILFLNISVAINVRATYEEEVEIFHSILSDLISLHNVLKSHNLDLASLAWGCLYQANH